MLFRSGYPEASSEKEILRRETDPEEALGRLRPLLPAEEVLELQEQVRQVRVDDTLLDYTLAIVNRTRSSEHLSLGASPAARACSIGRRKRSPFSKVATTACPTISSGW